MTVFFTILALAYLALDLALIVGNYCLPVKPSLRKGKQLAVSVLIPFRNEANNLATLIDALTSQDYSVDKIELIFIDDHSSDDGVESIKKMLGERPYQLLTMDQQLGKKAALRKGVENASNELIITTDADCRMNEKWVKSMATSFQEFNAHLLVGPVSFQRKGGIWNNLLRMEFAALIASTAGAIGINHSFMSNGANLAFSRSLYLSLEDDALKSKVASGDDVFLLHAIKSRFGRKAKINFAADEDALVETQATSRLKDFFKQRLRWTSKSKFYRDSFTILVGLLVSLGNFNLIFGLLATVFGFLEVEFLVCYFVIKWLMDSLLIYSAKKWTLVKVNYIITLFLSLLYPFYIISVALLSLLFKPQWKGRKIE
jgi:cellulose synthase/poly-beta-1,6-N-acetylglucosamine synthase-like glycosyltransferase